MVHTVAHAIDLLPAVLTHAVVGYALVAALTDAPPAVGALAGVAPDVDLFLGPPVGPFPWVHRGLVHTPAFVAAVVALLLLVTDDRRVATGVGVAWLSHLAVDTFTNTGIAWLYPLDARFLAFDLNAHAPVQTAVLWVASGLLVAYARRADGRRARGVAGAVGRRSGREDRN